MMTEDTVRKIIDHRLAQCRDEVDSRVDNMVGALHEDIGRVRDEMSGLRSDVHRITTATDEMSGSLKMIAETLGKLTDLPDTWAKVKGFWAVITWFKNNWFVFLLLGALIYASFWLIGINVTYPGRGVVEISE